MKIVFSGGKTGGHIYPAIAFINHLKGKHEIYYVGNKNSLEKELITKNSNVEFFEIEVIGLVRKKIFKNLSVFFKFIKGIRRVRKIFKRIKPDIVIGMGGFVSAPVIYAANQLKICTIMHEQNKIIGLTNKVNLSKTNYLLTSFKDTEGINSKRVKVCYSGNPQTILYYEHFKNRYRFFMSNLLIVGGSGGAKMINDFVLSNSDFFVNSNFTTYLVVGKKYYDEIENKYSNLKNFFIVPYIDNMKKFLEKIDLVISRSGATMIAELLGAKIPSILVPSPNVANNHQYVNAVEMEKIGVSCIISEDKMNTDLLHEVALLMGNGQEYMTMKKAFGNYKYIDSFAVLDEILNGELNDKE